MKPEINLKLDKEFIYKMMRLDRESESMWGYLMENDPNFCENISKRPSKELRARYGLRGHSRTLFHWWLMEKYLNGELVLKEKEHELNGEHK